MTLALVVGCAECVWDDIIAARNILRCNAVYCVKMIGVYWPGTFQVWVTLHPEFMDAYEGRRKALGLPDGYEIVAPPPGELGEHGAKGRISRRVSFRWSGMTASASSGIYGAKVALEDGHDRVVLAGIPMDNSKHFGRSSSWVNVSSFLPGMDMALPHLKANVRSLSGHTAKLLGRPSADWLGRFAR